ncbi:MAG: CocE/NonD family hydrolase [Planctomycetes bacterium]|nr:CocE/NonD family hydrolase [Planctomycetota bacterium]
MRAICTFRWAIAAAWPVALGVAALVGGALGGRSSVAEEGREKQPPVQGSAPAAPPAAGSPAAAGESGAWKPEIKDVRVPARDGKFLAGDVYLPPRPGKYPSVLIQTPYNKNRLGAVTGEAAADKRLKSNYHGLYDREHYAYVVVDWRGFYGSREAKSATSRGRGNDGFDTVEWIAKQAWSDGKVGTWGPSALGKAQFDTAAEKPPHLVCCVPLVATMGQTYEYFYDGGVFREAHVKALDALGFGVGVLRLFPLPDVAVWKNLERDTYHPDLLDVPMLLITGWWDNFPDAILRNFNDFRKKSGPVARENTYLLVGPWDHMSVDMGEQGEAKYEGAADVARKATLAFFDHYLRGAKNDGWEKTPVVRYYQCGENAPWVEAAQFPGRPVKEQTWNLTADGRITREAPGPATADKPLTRAYTYDPTDPPPTLGGANLPPLPHGQCDLKKLENRRDVLVYTTGKLSAPLRTCGNMRVSLSCGVNRADVDLAVWVADGLPDGRVMHVADAIQRAKLRAGKVEPLTPGAVVTVTVRLPVTAYTFGQDHELKVLVASGNSPRYGRNPHTGADQWEAAGARSADVTLYHDAARPASLVLPMLAGPLAAPAAAPPPAGPAEKTAGR